MQVVQTNLLAELVQVNISAFVFVKVVYERFYLLFREVNTENIFDTVHDFVCVH